MNMRLPLAIFIPLITVSLLLSATQARAYRPNKYYRYHHRANGWVTPPPKGASTWCKHHPHKCAARSNNDPKVNTRCEYCLDSNGNGDGYVSDWEMRTFRKECSPCN